MYASSFTLADGITFIATAALQALATVPYVWMLPMVPRRELTADQRAAEAAAAKAKALRGDASDLYAFLDDSGSDDEGSTYAVDVDDGISDHGGGDNRAADSAGVAYSMYGEP
jgi:hypothetical protein